jgi:hypothetical protein
MARFPHSPLAEARESAPDRGTIPELAALKARLAEEIHAGVRLAAKDA